MCCKPFGIVRGSSSISSLIRCFFFRRNVHGLAYKTLILTSMTSFFDVTEQGPFYLPKKKVKHIDFMLIVDFVEVKYGTNKYDV